MSASSELTPARARTARGLKDFWREIFLVQSPDKRRALVAITVALVLGIGVADFLLGFEVSLLVFYCLPVVLAVAAAGWKFGVFIAVASVGSWITGDIVAGAHYGNWVVPSWNAVIALGTYLVVIWLFAAMQTLQREMEQRVQERTAALTSLIAERERLEKAMLEIGERERRSIGQDLHDGLGQHLTGTALAGQVLGEKLQARNLSEEETDAWKIVSLIEEGIEKTRQLARGLLLAEIQPDALVTALQELAADLSVQSRIRCDFCTSGTVLFRETSAATHLFHIAQEAVRNSIRHGRARRVEIALAGNDREVELTIRDDGIGLPAPADRDGGLGLSIMKHRAEIVGGQFLIVAPTEGGTLVTCRVPAPTSSHE